MKKFNIGIANDHAGCGLKLSLLYYLQSKGLTVKNYGTDNETSVDYPDYAKRLTNELLEGVVEKGILICGTGIGMSIAANRRSGIRAALCNSEYIAEKARSHNDANVLVLGARIIDEELAIKILDTFLASPFEGGRHLARINKIS